ncbi:MAG: ATP-dependent Clp protease proteolytic subunit [Micavibrio sp.]|nr:ATP-dependent Clp protease proteolytic subunit [Micavibrio sp.]
MTANNSNLSCGEHFKARATENAVDFYGDVTPERVTSVIATLKHLDDAHPGEPITLKINSSGGSIIDGFLLIQTMMEEIRSPITTHVVGTAKGVAAAIAMAGDYRLISRSATIGLDAPYPGFWGSAARWESWLEEMAEQREMLHGFYAERCLKTYNQAEAEKLIHLSSSVFGIRAQALGFVHEVYAGSVKNYELQPH